MVKGLKVVQAFKNPHAAGTPCSVERFITNKPTIRGRTVTHTHTNSCSSHAVTPRKELLCQANIFHPVVTPTHKALRHGAPAPGPQTCQHPTFTGNLALPAHACPAAPLLPQQVRQQMQHFFRGYAKTWGSNIISIIGSIKSLKLIEPLAEINSSVIDASVQQLASIFVFSPSPPSSHPRGLFNLYLTKHGAGSGRSSSSDFLNHSWIRMPWSFKAEKPLGPVLMPWHQSLLFKSRN